MKDDRDPAIKAVENLVAERDALRDEVARLTRLVVELETRLSALASSADKDCQ